MVPKHQQLKTKKYIKEKKNIKNEMLKQDKCDKTRNVNLYPQRNTDADYMLCNLTF